MGVPSFSFTWANILTLLRLTIIPCLCYAQWHQAWGVALCLFCIAGITDVLDGICARTLNEETLWGTYTDPVVDKLLIISSYMFLTLYSGSVYLPAWFLYFITVKEVVILVGGFYFSLVRNHTSTSPLFIGKCAMVIHIMFIVWLLLILHNKWPYEHTIYPFLLLVTGITFLALSAYAYRMVYYGKAGV